MSVTVEDVNDNAPEFDRPDYVVELLENSPNDAVLFRAIVTDPDQVIILKTPETIHLSLTLA